MRSFSLVIASIHSTGFLVAMHTKFLNSAYVAKSKGRCISILRCASATVSVYCPLERSSRYSAVLMSVSFVRDINVVASTDRGHGRYGVGW